MYLQQSQREAQLLRKELETTIQVKNNLIIELENSLRKSHSLNRQLDERILTQEAEIRVLKEKNKELELFSRQRSHALTHKNIRIAQLEQQLENIVSQKIDKLVSEVNELKEIINAQQSQLTIYLEDHQMYLLQLEKLQTPFRFLNAQHQLLNQYNKELTNQIADVETANSELENWAVKMHEELAVQNEQGNDLLGQIEYITESLAR